MAYIADTILNLSDEAAQRILYSCEVVRVQWYPALDTVAASSTSVSRARLRVPRRATTSISHGSASSTTLLGSNFVCLS